MGTTSTKDMLKDLVQRQASLMREYGLHPDQIKYAPIGNREEIAFKICYAAIREITEIADEIGWKWWKEKPKIDSARLKTELIDLLHFSLELCILYGMDAEEIFDCYVEKNEANFERIKNERDT